MWLFWFLELWWQSATVFINILRSTVVESGITVEGFMLLACNTWIISFVTWCLGKHHVPILMERLRTYLSKWLYETNTVRPGNSAGEIETTWIEPRVVNQQFRDTAHTLQREPSHHTHPTSAVNRSAAVPFAKNLAEKLGMEPFVVQQSKSDSCQGLDGTRAYYWAKDVQVRPSMSVPTSNSLMVCVDTDYYLNMNLELLTNIRPWIIYTTLVSAVACAADMNASFTFNGKNELVSLVSGGAEYVHKLWNYNVDCLKVTRLGLTVTYSVERRMTADHHGYVLLVPTGVWRGVSSIISSWLLGGDNLTRLQVVHGEFLRLRVKTPTGVKMSTGRVGSYNCCTVPAEVDDALAAYARNTKVSINSPCVRTFFNDMSKTESMPLVEFHKTLRGAVVDTVFPVSSGVRSYQFSPPAYDPEAKDSLTAYMSPILPACFAPSQTEENEKCAVKGRVKEVRSTVQPTILLNKLISEFIELLIPEPHVGHPVEVEEVFEKQCRPSQRAILQNALDAGDSINTIIKSFLKKEAYGDIKDPRIISTINCNDKLGYSTYIYAIAAAMKPQPWYAFGKTPLEIAERVASLCERASVSAVNSDLSRFDGRVSPVARELESKVLMRYFAEEHAGDILRLHRSQFNQKAVTTKGVKYDTGSSRLSGSPETSCFNTLLTTFITYVAFRTHSVAGAFPTPQDAWERLGIYGGDDGLTMDIHMEQYEKAAAMVGQLLTVDEVPRGEFGITFLSRYFSDAVWFGNENSMCDLSRQLSKFHTTPNLPASVTPTQKLLEKSRSYFLTDANTPVIGKLVKKCLELSDSEEKVDGTEDPLGIRTWCSRVANENQYPNVYGEWMMHYVETSLTDFDQDRFDTYIASCRSLSDVLTPPVCSEPKSPIVKRDAVVDGEIVRVKESNKKKSRVRPRWNGRQRFAAAARK